MLHEQQAPPPAVAAPPPSINPDDDGGRDVEVTTFRDIHPLTPDAPPPASASWDTASHRSLSSSDDQQYMTMSREFTAMVAAGATMQTGGYDGAADQLTSIGEDELEETNPLAIVPDSNPIPSPRRGPPPAAPGADAAALVAADGHGSREGGGVSVGQVRKEEVESKIAAWQVAEVAKVNNRFKREEVVINGWEGDQVEKASAWLKKYERKLEEKRAKAMEKAQNEVAKARRKAEEKRASAEAKRGTKVARVLELANFMRAVGRAPSTKRSFF